MRKGNLLRYIKLGMLKHRAGLPSFLILYVTDKCNFRCKHCFINWEQDSKFAKNELSFEEIQRLAQQMGRLFSVSLTGGEPFLRSDLVEIAEVFVKESGTDNLFLPTNGSLVDKIADDVGRICAISSSVNVGIGISLDGLPPTHNDIRGNPAAFDNAIATATALSALMERHHNLSGGFITTLFERNFDEAKDIVRLVRSDFPRMGLSFNLFRGRPNPETGICLPQTERIREFLDYWNIEQASRSPRTIEGFAANAARRLLAKKTIETLDQRQQIIRCAVGDLYLVVYSNGDAAFCESLPPFGNIRDKSIRDLWNSPKADEQRERIQKKCCYCTHECFQPVNIAVNSQYYPELACTCLTSMLRKFWSHKK